MALSNSVRLACKNAFASILYFPTSSHDGKHFTHPTLKPILRPYHQPCGSLPSQCLRIGILSHLGDGQLKLQSTTFVSCAFISTLKQVILVAAAIDI